MLRIEATVQMNLCEALLPKQVFELNEELANVDALLDDEAITAAFAQGFAQAKGRPTVPAQMYLRLMYLKFRYSLGYEALVKEVSDSLMWRTFCRIGLDGAVPEATTLIKLTHKYGDTTIEALNEALVNRAVKDKVVRGRKLRVDTTAVESDIDYPTDAGLLAKGVAAITREVKKLDAQDVAGGQFHNRTRSVKYRLLEIAKYARKRSGDALSEVRAITRKIMKTAESVVTEVEEILERITTDSQQHRKLDSVLAVTKKVIEQTRKVEEAQPVKDRIVSLVDEDARPIPRGKRAIEFGYKALLTETEERIIIDYECLIGNPNDETLLEDTLIRSKEKLGRAPRSVATDRGFASSANDSMCAELGIKRISMPRKGRLSKKRKSYQKQSWFKRLQRFRAGGEATISLLKRKYGLKRTRLRGHTGAKIWVGWSILTHNLRRLSVLTG
ncbi:MAG TPA: ISNCY family transposase [Candidatus Aquicultor sp.]|jgi:IS5 family transposase